MTIEEFFAELDKAGKPFVLVSGQFIRTPSEDEDSGVCPVSFVANQLKGTNYQTDVTQPAIAINLPFKLADDIASAADGVGDLHPLRARLLRYTVRGADYEDTTRA